jgi:prephenate dehydrogenase
MRVSIVGGAGKMGRWFVSYFLNRGHQVILSDTRFNEAKIVAKLSGAELAKNNIEAVKKAELTVVSTPIEVTPKVLKQISKELEHNKTLMELSSLKSKTIPVLKEIAKKGVRTISIHPLFGPGVKRETEVKIALVPVFNLSSERKFVEKLFQSMEIFVVDMEKHDKTMALTLSLPHFLNIIFASIVSDENIELLRKLGGTTFTLQLMLCEGVMTEDPKLYSTIQINNKYTLHYIENLLCKAKNLKKQIENENMKQFSKLYIEIQDKLSKDKKFDKAYERMYKVLEAL